MYLFTLQVMEIYVFSLRTRNNMLRTSGLWSGACKRSLESSLPSPQKLDIENQY